MNKKAEVPIIKLIRDNRDFQNLIQELKEELKYKRVLFFSGAGVSRPSGLPTSPNLVNAILEAMEESLESQNIGSFMDRKNIIGVIKEYPLERLLDALAELYGYDSILEYLSVLSNAEENYNHIAIAQLAQNGWINKIVTLNFDTLFEQAFEKNSISYSWNLPLASENRIGTENPCVTIIKPHGTLPVRNCEYKPHYLAATLQYAGDRPQIETSHQISSIANETPVLFVSGYSDNDWDISPLLISAPWSKVFWCEHVNSQILSTDITKYPCERIKEWLRYSTPCKSVLLQGDCRMMFAGLLDQIDQGDIWKDFPYRKPDGTVFKANTARTAFAAIRLLDGTSNNLYIRMLNEFGINLKKYEDKDLDITFQRAWSWYNHAHKRKIRTAIRTCRNLLKNKYAKENNLQNLRDLKTLYYEYVSVAKRPYLNPFWPIDLLLAMKVKKRLLKNVKWFINNDKITPWETKEAIRQEAFTIYYKIDLLHNWGYHLLIFKNHLIRKAVQAIFKNISHKYQNAREKYPVLDWEYHYVRAIEAKLIASESLDLPSVNKKLAEIEIMFERTGRKGHLWYIRSVKAIISRSEQEFSSAENALIEDDAFTSPAGRLRMRIFRRYFWPDSITLLQTLKELIKYSSAQS